MAYADYLEGKKQNNRDPLALIPGKSALILIESTSARRSESPEAKQLKTWSC